MARDIQIKLAAVGAGEAAAIYAQVFSSATAAGTYAQVGTDINLTLLTPDVDGYYTLNTLADPTHYIQVGTIVAPGDAPRMSGFTLGPLPTVGGSVTLEVWAADMGLTAVEGLRFTVAPESGVTSTSTETLAQAKTVKTDATGYASITIPADVGTAIVSLEDFSVEFDTTDTSGTAVNFRSLIG